MPDEKQRNEAGSDDMESPKSKPVETEPSGAGYGNNAGPQDEVDED